MGFLTKIHLLLVKLGALLQTPVLFLIRVYWGYSFILTGWGKLHNLSKVTAYFASLHIPLPQVNALAVAATETIGGALLILGLCSRFAAAALIVLLAVAFGTAESDTVQALLHGNPDKFFAADPFLFLYAAVVVFCFGPGRLAVDPFLFPKPAA